MVPSEGGNYFYYRVGDGGLSITHIDGYMRYCYKIKHTKGELNARKYVCSVFFFLEILQQLNGQYIFLIPKKNHKPQRIC